MKKLSIALLAGVLTFGLGAASGFAGDRVLTPQGRSGFALKPDKQETTVAIFTGNRRSETHMIRDREERSPLIVQGRSGVKYRVE